MVVKFVGVGYIVQGDEMKYPVKRVCCKCGLDSGLADWEADEPGLVTHAYCPDCLDIEMEELESYRK